LAEPGGLQRAAQALGVLIQNLDVVFNPQQVVVGGASITQHPALLAQACAVVDAYARAAGVPAPLVRSARYGVLAAAVGAAAVAWHRRLRPMHGPDSGPAASMLPTAAPPCGADAASADAQMELEASL
jgi:hypothetical protein